MAERHEWSLNGLSMIEPLVKPRSGFWFETHADGFDLGTPEGTKAVLNTRMLDGDDVRIERWGNRQPAWTVEVKGYTTQDLADGERVLTQICSAINASRQGGVLRWKPPDGVGPPTLFEVRTADIPKLVVKDLDWVPEGDKILSYTFQMGLECGPWGYAENTTEDVFTPGAGTVTTVDNCTANTNWPGMTATTYLSLSAVRSAAIPKPPPSGPPGAPLPSEYYNPGAPPKVGTTIVRTPAIAAVAFIYLDIAVQGGRVNNLSMANTPGVGAPLASLPLTNGYTRYFWPRPTGTGLSLSVGVIVDSASAYVYVDQFGTSTTVPAGSLYGLNMKGSVRIQPQLRINHPSTNLGAVIVYTDPTMLNNGWDPSIEETWPAAPEGRYMLWIRPEDPYSAGDVISHTVAGITAETRTQWDSTEARWFPLGPFELGTNRSRRLGALGLETQMTLVRNGVDDLACDVRLFREDEDTSFLYVNRLTTLGGGDPIKRWLFIDPPSFDQPLPGLYAGNTEDGSDAISVLDKAHSFAWPTIYPPAPLIYVQTDTTTSPGVKATSRAAFGNFAAEY